MTESKDGWNYLKANAYHEAGHAIVGWALGGRVLEIKIRDDRPGENAHTEVPEDLLLIDRVAILNAGHEAEVVFGHFLPDWASSGDRTNTLNLLAANEIREIQEIEGWIAGGCAHARKVLRKHEREVHALAARLMECRRMAGDEFKRFVDTIKVEARLRRAPGGEPVDVDFSLRSSRGPRADRWPRSSARGRDGGIREELAAGAEGVNGPAGGSIQNVSGQSNEINGFTDGSF